MRIFTMLRDMLMGGDPLQMFLLLFIVAGLAVGVYSGFFKARKIQPNGFRWKTFRNEIFFAVLNVAASAFLIGGLSRILQSHGFITFNHGPTSWWVIALEYGLYWIAFDTYFYWFHRLMHVEPIYTYVHKIHHFSTSPNLLTTLSVGPLESLVNGGFVPLFTAAVTLHPQTMALIGPTNILMGLYVHAGYEFLPRWWNKSWATKWFITTTFHDQHHKYFNWNFGGYTTVWDWICGTVRPKYLADWDKLKARVAQPAPTPAPVTVMDKGQAA